MGFFSWLTADDKTSIANIYSGQERRTVYLLQPDGKAPIAEDAYEGYGEFGGVDAYSWLIETNAPALGIDLAGQSKEQIRMMGIGLALGSVCRDTESGAFWHIFHDYRQLVEGEFTHVGWTTPIPALGASAEQLINAGRFEMVSIASVLKPPYSLKFSFDPTAVYEDLPASEPCPHQGYFYD